MGHIGKSFKIYNMKNLILTTALLLSLTAIAQPSRRGHERLRAAQDMTAERKENGERERLTSDERFEMRNVILDRKIAQQEKLKEILTDEQFNLWKKTHHRKGMHDKKRMRKAGRRG
jgi:hypothetical protein